MLPFMRSERRAASEPAPGASLDRDAVRRRVVKNSGGPTTEGGPALRLAAARSVSAHLHLDALRLRLGLLRQVDEEHTLLGLGADVFRVDGRRQREGASERTVAQLETVIVLARGFLLELALALERQNAILESDLDVLRLDAGQLGANDDLLAVLVDVARGRPAHRLTSAEQLALVAEGAVHLLLHSRELAERVPSGQHSHDFPSFLLFWTRRT